MISTIMATGIPITTIKQPSLVMQLMIVSGSFMSFRTKLRGRVISPSNLKMA